MQQHGESNRLIATRRYSEATCMSFPKHVAMIVLLALQIDCSAETQKPCAITFEVALPELEGPITLGVFSKDGSLVRLLYRDTPIDKIPSGLNGLLVTWDGRDDQGGMVAPGIYRARGIIHGSLQCSMLPSQLGTNPMAPNVNTQMDFSPNVSNTGVTASSPPEEIDVPAAEDALYAPRPKVTLTPRIAGRSITLQANGLPVLDLPAMGEDVEGATFTRITNSGMIHLNVAIAHGTNVLTLIGFDKLAPIEAGTLEVPADAFLSPGESQE